MIAEQLALNAINVLPIEFDDLIEVTRLPFHHRDPFDRLLVADGDGRAPLISSVYGDWHGLPPLLIHVGEDEILLDDAVRSAAARAAGVDVRLETYPRMWHVFQLFLSLPQAVESLDDIARFLKAHLGRGMPVPGLPPAPAKSCTGP